MPFSLSHFSRSLKFFVNGADLFFPPLCVLCGQEMQKGVERVFCQDCFLDTYQPHRVQTVPTFSVPGRTKVFRAGQYTKGMAELIKNAKFRADPLSIRATGILMSYLAEEVLANEADRPSLVTSVPFVRSHLRKRGMDLPYYLGRKICRENKLPFSANLIRRSGRKISPQVSLPHRERKKNLVGEFDTSDGFRAKSIWVVDDVFTTGATMNAVVKPLAEKTGASIIFLVLAETPHSPNVEELSAIRKGSRAS